jgi:beta-phosphoglucomutase-like phosphatase (HAD superfamily)
MLGLPESVRATLFDLDGVLTQTAKVYCLSVVRLVVFPTLERTLAIELAPRRP